MICGKNCVIVLRKSTRTGTNIDKMFLIASKRSCLPHWRQNRKKYFRERVIIPGYTTIRKFPINILLVQILLFKFCMVKYI